MKTILVTGGAGYVGSHCCKEFAKQGCTVVVYDNLSRGWRDVVRWGEPIEGDILDFAMLQKAIADVRPDVLAHFAAYAYVDESVHSPGILQKQHDRRLQCLGGVEVPGRRKAYPVLDDGDLWIS